MAQQVTLDAAIRTDTGKGVARSLRRAGKVPGVIYGHNRTPEALVVDAPALGKLLSGISAGSTVLDVAIDGRAPVKALIREIQRNPVKPIEVLHIDLYEVRADEKVVIELPVRLVGTPDGVRNFGGVLDHVIHEITIKVLPGDIPESADVDVSALGVGQSLFVRDIKIANAEIMTDGDLPVCSVVAPRVEEAPAVEEAPSAEPELIRKPKPEGEGEAS